MPNRRGCSPPRCRIRSFTKRCNSWQLKQLGTLVSHGCVRRSNRCNAAIAVRSDSRGSSHMPARDFAARKGTSLPNKSLSAMVRPATALIVLSVGAAYLAYKYWATYPNLIPNQRALRRIERLAGRKGISREAAYIEWSNKRLKSSRFRSLVREPRAAPFPTS
jgi:hypothetical protein